jgi:ATP-dependent DNA helicase RecG
MEKEEGRGMEEMKEYQRVEFKESWRDDYLKTLCAFANTDGGVMYIGRSDKGEPIELKNTDYLLETLPNKIRHSLNILPSVKSEYIKGIEVIKIEIPSSEVPISYKGKFYIRSGSTTQEVSGMELVKFVMKRQKLSWDTLLSDAGLDEIDEETVLKFKNMAKDRLAISEKDSIEKILENLELLKEGKLTNAGLLLFGKNTNKYLLNTITRVGRFKTQTEIIDTVEIKGIERKDIWDYPLPAIREACINALTHRDYMDPAEIQIKIYDDHIWFWNPGRLPEGITVDMLKDEHFSKPRNRLIAMVFYYAGLIERWGTGTKRMVELCKEQGLPEPDFKEFGNGFSVIFYKDIYNEENLRKMGLNERQIKAVLYVKERREITNKEYQKINSCSRNTATNDLRELVDKGILQQSGKKGAGAYYVIAQ